MRWVKYSRYTGEDFGLGAEDLLQTLSDFFLESGFNNPYMQFSEFNQHTLEELKKAIEEALEEGRLFDPERAEDDGAPPAALARADGPIAGPAGQKLVDEGYISTEETEEQEPGAQGGGRCRAQDQSRSDRQELDFLGFKTLKDLLGSLGHSSFGAHDTRDLATGVETTRRSEACTNSATP